MKLPTVSEIKRSYKLSLQCGCTPEEAFNDVVADLLCISKALLKAAEGWEKAHDKLKAKYEPCEATLNDREGTND